MHLRDICAADRDTDRMPTGVTRFVLDGRSAVVFCCGVVAIGDHRTLVLVGSRPVVMIRMIVTDVLVYVQRRSRGRRDDQGTAEHDCDQTAHEDSLLRANAEVWNDGGNRVSGQKPWSAPESPPSVLQQENTGCPCDQRCR
jgi:hypothetical protein